ncbi:hypothetical protein [Dactylosporangium sp. NPDC005555]|uniref:hypothetical protein n=1 Tax=Dactylosporangium sp. NPDC005555 TaxID=3154889 RepID=UPI0033B54A2A
MSTTTRDTTRRATRAAGFLADSGQRTGRDTARAARRIARGVASLGVVAAVAVGGSGSLLVARPAHAATAEVDIEAKMSGNNFQGKVGAKVSVGYQIINHGNVDVAVNVAIRVPQNTEIESAGACQVAGNRRTATCQLPKVARGSSAGNTIQVVLRTAGDGDGGSVVARLAPNQGANDPKDSNNKDDFKIRVAAASATPSASKSTRSSRSASADPTGTSDEVVAPPEAGNGAIPREDPTKAPVSSSGGLGFGFWVGVVAIVAALGLVGSLFYFRRKDRLEPDTGVFHLPPMPGNDNPTSVIAPGVYGSPAAGPGFQGSPGGPSVYGAPAGAPPPPAFPPPAFPPPAFPPPAGPPAGAPGPGPGANDQTIIMRRPDDL